MNQKGFSLVEGFLGIFVLAIVVLGGWYVISNNTSDNDEVADEPNALNEDLPEISEVVDEIRDEDTESDEPQEEQPNEPEEEVEVIPVEPNDVEKITDFDAFVANNSFQTVEIRNGVSFMLPSDWTVNDTLVNSSGGVAINNPESSVELTLWDYDVTVEYTEGGLDYAKCSYYLGAASYESCQNDTHSTGLNEVFAATRLTGQRASQRFLDENTMERSFVLYGETYLQGRFVEEPSNEDNSIVFDYILHTISIP